MINEAEYRQAFYILSDCDLEKHLNHEYPRLNQIKKLLIKQAKTSTTLTDNTEWAEKVFNYYRIYQLESGLIDEALDSMKDFSPHTTNYTLKSLARYGASQEKLDELYGEGYFEVVHADEIGVTKEAKESRLSKLIVSSDAKDISKIDWLSQNVGRELKLEELEKIAESLAKTEK